MELLIEDEKGEFQGNANKQWFCSKSKFNNYIMSLLHPVQYRKTWFCKLPTHEFTETYNYLLITEEKEVKSILILIKRNYL